MAIAKKQFEVEVIARIVAVDTDGAAVDGNFATIIDELVIDGVEVDLRATAAGGPVSPLVEVDADTTVNTDLRDAIQAIVTTHRAIS